MFHFVPTQSHGGADFQGPIGIAGRLDEEVEAAPTHRPCSRKPLEQLLRRADRGPLTDVDWRRLIDRWAGDYSFDRADVVRRYLAPRGLDNALERLRAVDPETYVVTGSVAAGFYAPCAPADLLMVYAHRPDVLAAEAELRPVESGANVLVAANEDDFAFARSSRRDELTVAAPSQVAVDLHGGPGRSPAEAESLLEWMQENEGAWRRARRGGR